MGSKYLSTLSSGFPFFRNRKAFVKWSFSVTASCLSLPIRRFFSLISFSNGLTLSNSSRAAWSDLSASEAVFSASRWACRSSSSWESEFSISSRSSCFRAEPFPSLAIIGPPETNKRPWKEHTGLNLLQGPLQTINGWCLTITFGRSLLICIFETDQLFFEIDDFLPQAFPNRAFFHGENLPIVHGFFGLLKFRLEVRFLFQDLILLFQPVLLGKICSLTQGRNLLGVFLVFVRDLGELRWFRIQLCSQIRILLFELLDLRSGLGEFLLWNGKENISPNTTTSTDGSGSWTYSILLKSLP